MPRINKDQATALNINADKIVVQLDSKNFTSILNIEFYSDDNLLVSVRVPRRAGLKIDNDIDIERLM